MRVFFGVPLHDRDSVVSRAALGAQRSNANSIRAAVHFMGNDITQKSAVSANAAFLATQEDFDGCGIMAGHERDVRGVKNSAVKTGDIP